MIDRHRVDTFAAELTVAVYRLALRHGAGERWLELQLGLWNAVTDTIDKWASDLRDRGSVPGETGPS
jgi:hypothetical protein